MAATLHLKQNYLVFSTKISDKFQGVFKLWNNILRNLLPQVPIEFVRVRPNVGRLKLIYDDVRRLGVDRWLSMLAASTLFDGQILLISAGTALTVDKLSASGQHLGGMIAPGWPLLKRSFALTKVSDAPSDAFRGLGELSLGVDTRSCLDNGLSMMMLSFIECVNRQFADDCQHIILCGGDARALAQALPHISCHRYDHLVLDGLSLLCSER